MRTYRQKPSTPPAYRISEVITEHDIRALRALEEGTASPDQQRLALRTVLVKLSGTYDQPVVLGQNDQTLFRGGRAFVGQKLLLLLRHDLTQLLGEPQDE